MKKEVCFIKNVAKGLKKKLVAVVLAITMVTAVAVPALASPTVVMADEKSFEDQVKDAKKKIYDQIDQPMNNFDVFNKLAPNGAKIIEQNADMANMPEVVKDFLVAVSNNMNPLGDISDASRSVAKFSVVLALEDQATELKDNKVMAQAYSEVISEFSKESGIEMIENIGKAIVSNLIPGGNIITAAWDWIRSLFG